MALAKVREYPAGTFDMAPLSCLSLPLLMVGGDRVVVPSLLFLIL